MTIDNHLQLTIEKLIYGGDGLARLPADESGRGRAIFVPFVLPGEEVEAALFEQKPGFARARLENILRPSPRRVVARCPYFQRCGGCHYQHAEYEHQLEIKVSIFKENLRRIAKVELEAEPEIHPSPPWNYRNRARLKVRATPEFALGYHKFGSHELLPVEDCPISSPAINRGIAAVWELGRAGQIDGAIREIEFFADASDSQMLVEIDCGPEASAGTAEQWAVDFAEVVAWGRWSRGVSGHIGALCGRCGTGSVGCRRRPELHYGTRRASYRVTAGAFFQVNRHMVDVLVDIVTENRSGELALDLFAGGGLFSLVLARSFAQVIAVEASQTAHADLLYNSPGNVKVVRAVAEQYLKNAGSRLRPGLVVVDPPRSGLGEGVVRALAASGAPRMSYVSCDPATLARDLGGLLRAGYRVEQTHLVDLFPQTFHLESVVQLVRG